MGNIDKNKILILYNSVSYFMEEIKKRDYQIFELYINEDIKTRIIRKLLKKFKLEDDILYGNWKKYLKKVDIIILFSPLEDAVLEFIKKKNPIIKIIYWYWNPAYRIGRPTEILKNETELWTFDLNDASNYKMKYNNSFYFNSISIPKKEIKFDVSFIGRNKHRKEKLLEYKDHFEKNGFKIFFHIVPNNNERKDSNTREYSYEEYLDVMAESKAILEIMPPSQVGLTIRPLEATFLEKKLITDNVHVEKEPFFNPANIFILGKRDFNELKSFLETPFQPINKEIIENYDFDNWIERILSNEEFKYDKFNI